jgi:site-specific DNA recombinase
MTGDDMKAIGYIRVSTDGQAENGVSLAAQRDRIQAWADANGYTLAALYSDAGLSGKRADNRPGFQRAITQVCREKAALVVYSLSRLSRSVADTCALAERLNRAGADLVSLSERIDTTSAAGRMVFNMLAVLSQFEREQIGERTRTAMSHLRRQNRRISGQIPYGYALAADGATLVEVPAEQGVIGRICDLHSDGHSLRGIAADLAAHGILSKTGRAWTAPVIRGIIRRAEGLNRAA